MKTIDTGFDFQKVRLALDSEEWERDREDPAYEVRRTWLGTIFGITPSGKFYTPFACSNVAGDCPTCNGSGSIEPRTGKRVRARAKRRQSDYARGTIARGGMGSAEGKAYADRVRKARHAAFTATNTTCETCDGTGSRSAARDARWTEEMERLAESIGAHLDYHDESIFVAESRAFAGNDNPCGNADDSEESECAL